MLKSYKNSRRGGNTSNATRPPNNWSRPGQQSNVDENAVTATPPPLTIPKKRGRPFKIHPVSKHTMVHMFIVIVYANPMASINPNLFTLRPSSSPNTSARTKMYTT